MDDHDTFYLKRETLSNDLVQQMLTLLEERLFQTRLFQRRLIGMASLLNNQDSSNEQPPHPTQIRVVQQVP